MTVAAVLCNTLQLYFSTIYNHNYLPGSLVVVILILLLLGKSMLTVIGSLACIIVAL